MNLAVMNCPLKCTTFAFTNNNNVIRKKHYFEIIKTSIGRIRFLITNLVWSVLIT